MATIAQLEERMPVWEAFSEFFLDTELQPSDHERIASALAKSRYNDHELNGILEHEVCPACKGNLLSVAGEWAGFHPDWLREEIAPRYDKRPLFNFSIRHRWMYQQHWRKVRTRVAELRAN